MSITSLPKSLKSFLVNAKLLVRLSDKSNQRHLEFGKVFSDI